MTEVSTKDSVPVPAERTGGPPSGVSGHHDNSAISNDAKGNEGGSVGQQQI